MVRLPRRPGLRLLAPRSILLGESAQATVVLDVRKPVRVRGVDVAIERQAYLLGLPPWRVTARVSGPRELEVGEHSLPFRFEVPASGPPTYTGRVRVGYVAQVHVDVPWWPDRRGIFVLRAVAPPGEPGPASPLLFSPHPQGAPPGTASFECSLADTRLVPGGIASGTVALGNPGSVSYRGVEVSLVGTERAPAGAGQVFEAKRYTLSLAVPPGGSTVPFRMKLPDDLPPSWSGPGYELAWRLSVRARVAFGRDAEGAVAIVVAPVGTPQPEPPRAAVPSVGDERVARVWAAVAQEHGLRFDGDRLVGGDGRAELVVRRDLSRGARLVAELTYPSLRLHLDGGTRRGFRRFVLTGVDLESVPWGSSSYVTGRDPAQAAHAARALARACFGLAGSPVEPKLAHLRLDDLADDRLVLGLADPGTTLGPLRTVVQAAQRVLRVATQLPHTVPPPSGHEDAVPAWRELAKALGGELETSCLGVAGSRGGLSASVRTEWTVDGTPTETVVEVAAPFPIDAERRFAHVGSTDGAALPGSLGADARAALAGVMERVVAVEVFEDRLVARCEPDEDPASALRVVDGLLALGAALRVGRGPFR